MMRRLPRLAFIPLVVIATYSTLGALVLVHDRGDDFRRFYTSAVEWAHGGNPYALIDDTPNLNHPILLPVMRLFTMIPEPTGFIVWSICSLVLLVACAPSIGRSARLAPLDVIVTILAATGTFLALAFGQVSFLLMAMFTRAWYADRTGRAVEAGVWLGALTVLKPFYGLFAVYFLWRRLWRALVAYVTVFIAGTIVGLFLVGTSNFQEWLARLGDIRWRWHIYNASVWGVGDRLFSVQSFFRATGWTPIIESTLLARLTTAVLVMIVVWVIVRAVSKGDTDRSYAVLGLGSLLLSPLGWLYYLPAFLGPVIAVLGRRPSRWLWPLTAIAICPYTLLVNRAYGIPGTLLVGQWALAVVGGLFLLVASPNVKETPSV
jgi:hypothetical protein